MPFTLAHPAAALPLARPLGRLAVPSALVAGSVAPDLGYFLPLGVSRDTAHSLVGLFAFCLPIGVGSWALFHVLLKHPLAALLPRSLYARVSTHLGVARRLPPVAAEALLVSVLVGAASHVAWDALTHDADTWEQMAWLQGGSSLLGVLLLVFWTWRWLRNAPPAQPPPAEPLPPLLRAAVLAALVAFSSLAALRAGVHAVPPSMLDGFFMLASFASRAVVGGVTALGAGLVLFGVLWHLRFPAQRTRS